MEAFLEYEIKVAVALAVFSLFYRLLLSKETFHRFNRIVLLVTSALAFLLPFCVVVVHKTIEYAGTESSPAAAGDAAASAAAASGGPGYFHIGLLSVYLLGVGFMLFRSAYSLIKIKRLIAGGRHIPQKDGTTLVLVSDKEFSPVSWMKYIVMSEEDNSSTGEAILIHERAHIALGHSWDILFFDLMSILQWFNPAVWLLKIDLRALHEYEADEAVMRAGTDVREYQLLLVRKAVAAVRYPVANSLTHSTLKNRIKMMSSKRSSLYRALKALYVIPLVAVSLIANAETKYEYVYDESDKKITVPVDTVCAEGQTPETIYIVDGKIVASVEDVFVEEIESVVVINAGSEKAEEVKEKNGIKNPDASVIIISLKKDVEVSAKTRPAVKDESVVKLLRYRKNSDADEVVLSAQTDKDGAVVDISVVPDETADVKEIGKWLNSQLLYPSEAKQAKAEGCVLVGFDVMADGSVTGVKVVRSVHPALDAEVVKRVSASPKWAPAYKNGKAVRASYTLPVVFDIKGYEGTVEPVAARSNCLLDAVYVISY